MRVAVDLDGVVCDFVTPFLGYLNRKLGKRVGYQDIHRFDFRHAYGLSARDMAGIWEEVNSSGKIYSSLEAYPGAISALKDICDTHDVTFVTGRPSSLCKETTEWLQAHGLCPPGELVFAPNERHKLQRLKQFDLVIEDKLDVARVVAACGVKVLLYKHPWNEIPQQLCWASTWEEIMRTVSEENR